MQKDKKNILSSLDKAEVFLLIFIKCMLCISLCPVSWHPPSKTMNMNQCKTQLYTSFWEPLCYSAWSGAMLSKKNKNIWEGMFILQRLTKSIWVVVKKCRQLKMGGATYSLWNSFTNLWHWLKVTPDKQRHFPGRCTRIGRRGEANKQSNTTQWP